jgi:serine/tyrosine/threonine adenylyltransferase
MRRRLNEDPGLGQARAAAMRAANPAFIPRNHVVDAALDAAVWRQDLQPFEELLDVVSRPYEDRPNLERYATPARPEECVSQTSAGRKCGIET